MEGEGQTLLTEGAGDVTEEAPEPTTTQESTDASLLSAPENDEVQKEGEPKDVKSKEGEATSQAKKTSEEIVLEPVKDSPYFDESFTKGIAKIASDMKLSKDAALALHKSYTERVVAKQRELVASQKDIAFKEWPKQVREDKELGGEKFKENLTVAHRAYLQFAPVGLRQLLDSSGLANHPEMVRMFMHLGRKLQDDKAVITNTTPKAQKSPEELFYGDKK